MPRDKAKAAAYNKAWRAANPERVRGLRKAWAEANPEKVRAGVAAWRKANPGWWKAWSEKNRERINEGQRRRAPSNPNYRLLQKERVAGRPCPATCEVCDGPAVVRGLVFDHDHKTGAFRGWLCHHCNIVLGHVRDSQWRLWALIEYLDEHEAGVAA